MKETNVQKKKSQCGSASSSVDWAHPPWTGRVLGSSPKLVTDTWLRDGCLVVSCDKRQSRSAHDQRQEKARHEGGSKNPNAPPGVSETRSSSGYTAMCKGFRFLLLRGKIYIFPLSKRKRQPLHYHNHAHLTTGQPTLVYTMLLSPVPTAA